jgi:hypothetical protein
MQTTTKPSGETYFGRVTEKTTMDLTPLAPARRQLVVTYDQDPPPDPIVEPPTPIPVMLPTNPRPGDVVVVKRGASTPAQVFATLATIEGALTDFTLESDSGADSAELVCEYPADTSGAEIVPGMWRIVTSWSLDSGGGGGGSTSHAWIGGLREGGVDLMGGPYDVAFNVGPADGDFLEWAAGPTSTGFNVLRVGGVFARVGVTGFLGEGGDGGEKVTIQLVDSSDNVVDSCQTEMGTAATGGGQQSAGFVIDRITNIPEGTGYKVRIISSTATQYALGRVELSIVSIGEYTIPE